MYSTNYLFILFLRKVIFNEDDNDSISFIYVDVRNLNFYSKQACSSHAKLYMILTFC